MDSDLLHARRLGLILLRDRVPEGVRVDPPFLRYDPELHHARRAELIWQLLPPPPGAEGER